MADEPQNIDRPPMSERKFMHDLATIAVPGIFDYVRSMSRIPAIKQKMIEETRALFGDEALMATDNIESEFIGTLIAATGAKKVLELGVFTGFSSLSIAEALPSDGHLYALDISEEFTSVARKYWALAGVDSKITLTLAPARETMARFIAEGHSGTFDLIYIDADKESELEYYETALILLRTGGVILVDNVLWFGSVLEYHPDMSRSSTDAVRALNEFIHTDQRVKMCMIPIADGVTMAVKK